MLSIKWFGEKKCKWNIALILYDNDSTEPICVEWKYITDYFVTEKIKEAIINGVLNILSIVRGDIFPDFFAHISAKSREVMDLSTIMASM